MEFQMTISNWVVRALYKYKINHSVVISRPKYMYYRIDRKWVNPVEFNQTLSSAKKTKTLGKDPITKHF